MKKLARLLSYASAILSATTLLPVRDGWGAAGVWIPKVLAGAWSPFLLLAGGLGALFGLRRKDLAAVTAGLFGAAVSARYIGQVSAPHDGFERAFGPDWRARIPPDLRARLRPSRYSPLPPGPPPVPWEWDVVFGTHLETGDPLVCDIWQPPRDVPRTGLAVIYLHGSGWHYVDKDVGTRPFFRHLAGQGHLIMDVAYTLAPKARLHAMLADVKRAVAWIKINADHYGLDPERIVLMGGSAGGHLALLAAYTPNQAEFQPADVETDTSVRAVVSYYGPPDLHSLHQRFKTRFDVLKGEKRLEEWIIPRMEPVFHRTRFLAPDVKAVGAGEMIPGLLGGTPDQVPELYELGSPINHVGPHCPPTLLLQGADDLSGMTPDVRRLHRALLAAGLPSIYVEYPHTEHGFDLMFPRWSPAAQAATYETEHFLALMAQR
jgi:acetyl esterase/lipase